MSYINSTYFAFASFCALLIYFLQIVFFTNAHRWLYFTFGPLLLLVFSRLSVEIRRRWFGFRFKFILSACGFGSFVSSLFWGSEF